MPVHRHLQRLQRAALVACTSLVTACASGPGGGDKLALVIGNAGYTNAPALSNPVHDANDMCAALRRLGFRTTCLTDLRDRAEFDARVTEYVRQLEPNSVGVVYYSGHGVQADNASFLIPTAVEVQRATEDPLRVLYGVEDLFQRLRERPSRFQLVVLDACRTDLFAPARAAAGGAPAAARSGLIRALEGTGRARNGLAPITQAPPGTMVLYATASKEAAFDGEGRNGPLTKHILAHIGTPGIAVEEFVKRVTNGVETETLRDYRKRQSPFVYSSFGARFCFAGCPGEIFVPPAH